MKQQHIEYHKDGSIWAKGDMEDGAPEGYWEWFRKDGSKMRSGYFKKGEQIGAGWDIKFAPDSTVAIKRDPSKVGTPQ